MSQINSKFRHLENKSFAAGDNPEKLVLDEEHLSHYTLGDDALAIEILKLFTTQVDIYLDGLKVAKDGIDWQQVAHGLKGSARAIGAWALADLAEQAEHGILSDVSQTRDEYLPQLTEQVRRTKAQIANTLLKK